MREIVSKCVSSKFQISHVFSFENNSDHKTWIWKAFWWVCTLQIFPGLFFLLFSYFFLTSFCY